MVKRVIVGVIFVPLLVAVFVFAPEWAAAVVVAVINAISAYEFMAASGRRGERGYMFWTPLAIVCAAFIPYFVYERWGGARIWVISIMYILTATAVAVFFLNVRSIYKRGRKTDLPIIQYAIMSGIVFPICLSSIADLRLMPDFGSLIVLLPIVCAFVTDAGAYFVGVKFGKKHPFPNISPKKSIEGFMGGLIIGALAVGMFGVLLQNKGMKISTPWFAFLGLIGAAATEVGDLAFSLVKRHRGIKDYGNLLPGHGGMLDRFDSMVFCAPVMWGLIRTLMPL